MAEVLVMFNPAQLAEARSLLRDVKDGIGKAMAGAINDTANQEKTSMSRAIRTRVNIKAADIKPYIEIYPRAKPNHLSSGIHLSKSERIPLKYFGAKQVAAGVTYKIQTGGSRRMYLHAFGPNIARLGHQVFARTGQFRVMTKGRYKGKVREVIAGPKRGPSPWGVFVKNNLLPPAEKETADLLEKNLNQRIKFLLLKQAGAI